MTSDIRIKYLPNILITTSRFPSQKVIQFSKELRSIFTYSIFLNRGNMKIKDLYNSCIRYGIKIVVIIHENGGSPSILIIY